jgi:hypothetical protein
MIEIFIKGYVPSSKNSKQWTGSRLISSKTVRKYLSVYETEWLKNRSNFLKLSKGLPKPLKVGFYFIRDSKRKFDYINAAQLPCDLMTKHGWIDDDNCDCIIPVFLGYHVDKAAAGVVITVLSHD